MITSILSRINQKIKTSRFLMFPVKNYVVQLCTDEVEKL